MMHERKRILSNEVTGDVLWQTDQTNWKAQRKGDVLQVHADPVEDSASNDRQDGVEDDEDVGAVGATVHADAQHTADVRELWSDVVEEQEDAEMVVAAEHADEGADAVSVAEHADERYAASRTTECCYRKRGSC